MPLKKPNEYGKRYTYDNKIIIWILDNYLLVKIDPMTTTTF